MKKILTCLCLSIFICISILKPISIYAYTDLNTYIESDLSVEDAKDYVAQTILAYALATGAEMVVPGSGSTVAEITDKVWDVIDFTDELYSWAIQAKRKMQDGYLPWEDVTYNLNPGSANYNAPILLAWDRLKDNWNNDREDIPTNPDTNYLPYIELINGKSFNFQYLLADNWLASLNNDSLANNSQWHFTKLPNTVSYFKRTIATLDKWNSSSNQNSYISSFYSSGPNYITRASFLSPLSIYINFENGIYYVTTSTMENVSICSNIANTNNYYEGNIRYLTNTHKFDYSGNFSTVKQNNLSFYYYSASLEDCFKVISMNFRNVNLYVNGNAWSIITEPPEPIQLGGNTYITNTNTPVYYDFPNGTLFDANAFTAIMRQLIDLNNTGNAITIQLDDVLESFTDEYGVTAQYVVNVVRNDYDNLLSEQYGNYALTNIKGINYPKEQIQPYTSTMEYVTNESTDLIPNDILIVLAGTGVLILFAFLINRMLE